ncbi:protein phosphatase 2C domain-containing protein [Actinomadura flavalba]|uniref:protein phosphatase 2C domain-containing protein n=1 Tax=Actinomadura flavalba TaxID=1120938 RepID=UPI0003783E8F|nr:protein phosphatase 2C domain-containing protein [Actinomadura flavalba]
MTLVRVASEPGSPGRENEDFAAASASVMVVIDGAGSPEGLESGCRHSVAWYARNLCGLLLTSAADQNVTLADALATSIERVNALHSGTCDLGHPGSPSATVAVARVLGDDVEHLVLADAVLVLDRVDGRAEVVTDTRLADVVAKLDEPGGLPPLGPDGRSAGLRRRVEELAAHRNQPGGFWVASADPQAAEHALTGTTAVADLAAVALLSDGASRLADRFHLLDWRALLQVLHEDGPAELIARTRAAERTDPHGSRWPRGKASDDASAVYRSFSKNL